MRKVYMIRDKKTGLYWRNQSPSWVDINKAQIYLNIAGCKTSIGGCLFGYMRELPNCPDYHDDYHAYRLFYRDNKEKAFQENFEIIECVIQSIGTVDITAAKRQ